MTDAEIDEKIGQLQGVIEWLLALKRARGADLSSAPLRDPRRRRKVDAADAFHRRGFEFNDEKIQRLCRKYQDRWARKYGTWCVIEPDFSDFMDRVERGEAEF